MVLSLFSKSADKQQKSNNWIFGTILGASIVGLIASFVLTVEKAHLMQNPDAVLSCSINLVLNCASVMKTWQAEVFGFANSYIGLMAYPVLITIAIGYFAGARYKRWFMNGAQIGATLGAIFAYWLFFQSVYVIQVLCPWCLFVTVATTLIFDAITRYNLHQNNFNLPRTWNSKVQVWLSKDYDKFITASWLAVMVILVFVKFPSIFG